MLFKVLRLVQRRRNALGAGIWCAWAAATLSAQPPTPVLTTLHAFTGFPNDGAWPYAGVVIGANGVLYGTTNTGGNAGTDGSGTVFSLTPPKSPGDPWKEAVLWNFGNISHDGSSPVGAALGSGGVLYGATTFGGTREYGAVFSLAPPAAPGGDWTEGIVHSFYGGDDGSYPQATVTVGPSGVLYGTTSEGGFPQDDGTVYALVPPVEAPPGVIHFFAGAIDGSYPYAPVTGSHGVLYGTTSYAGTDGGGTVFSLKPPASQGGAWTETVIYQLPAGPPGDGQNAVVRADAKGVLYGTLAYGASGFGSVFMLQPPASAGDTWTLTVLHSFGGSDGSYPATGVLPGSAGELYGTTANGGTTGEGTVFVLKPPASPGGAWTETVLYNFTGGADGGNPNGLAIDSKGVLYGTTVHWGTTAGSECAAVGCGTVFSLTP